MGTCWVHNPSAGTAAPWPSCAECCVNVINTRPCKPSLQAQVGEVWILHENFSHVCLRREKKVAGHKVRLGKYFYASLNDVLVIWKGQPCHHGSLLCPFKAGPYSDKSLFWVSRFVWDSLLNSMRSLLVFRIFWFKFLLRDRSMCKMHV